MIYLRLFWEFFKTGLFAVGGGLATLPFLSDLGHKTGWFTDAMLANMVAVAESTPGPIGVNTATYVGFTVGGIPGGVIATLGLVAPSLVIILIIATLLKTFADNHFVKAIFKVLRAISVAMVLCAGLSVAQTTLLNPEYAGILDFLNYRAVLFFIILLVFIQFVPKTKKWHPIIFIGISAVVGLIAF
ncbi:MAG: chromate transporter [Lachnospiraceae bacterium]|nr:chromate transporter [Candidatus Equihabitans merdae]